MTRHFASPDAFKTSLESRLLAEARSTGANVQRLRQLVVFDRFLARLHRAFPERAIVKGGVVLELRIAAARATRDLDVSVLGTPRRIEGDLVDAALADLGDNFRFTLARDAKHPTIDGDAVRYGGMRFRCEARLGRAIYGDPFGVDVVFGHDLYGAPDILQSPSFLGFVGVAPTLVRATNRETHVAEKLHAYTQPRPKPNSRVKDLPDLAILAATGPFHAATLRGAIDHVFAARATHPVPAALPMPNAEWEQPYARIAQQNSLRWRTLADIHEAAASFLAPVLVGMGGVWNPGAWRWETL